MDRAPGLAKNDGGIVVRSAIFSLAIAVLSIYLPAAAAAESAGVVTILEGNATVIRGLSKYALAEGVRILGDDLVETDKSAFVRVEFTDGAMVDLGPATRAQLNRPSMHRFDRPALYLLSGWLKLSTGSLTAGAKASFAANPFDATSAAGQCVARVAEGANAVFAEEGAIQLMNRRAGGKAATTLKSGDFLALRGAETSKVESRPNHEFVAALPRQFQDPLPSRIARFKDRAAPAKPLGAFTYSEVEGWLDAEPVIRRRFVTEWAAKASDVAFRERLDAGLARHPEWERVLYPERFEPKPPASAASNPSATGAGGPNAAERSVSAPAAGSDTRGSTPMPGVPSGAATH